MKLSTILHNTRHPDGMSTNRKTKFYLDNFELVPSRSNPGGQSIRHKVSGRIYKDIIIGGAGERFSDEQIQQIKNSVSKEDLESNIEKVLNATKIIKRKIRKGHNIKFIEKKITYSTEQVIEQLFDIAVYFINIQSSNHYNYILDKYFLPIESYNSPLQRSSSSHNILRDYFLKYKIQKYHEKQQLNIVNIIVSRVVCKYFILLDKTNIKYEEAKQQQEKSEKQKQKQERQNILKARTKPWKEKRSKNFINEFYDQSTTRLLVEYYKLILDIFNSVVFTSQLSYSNMVMLFNKYNWVTKFKKFINSLDTFNFKIKSQTQLFYDDRFKLFHPFIENYYLYEYFRLFVFYTKKLIILRAQKLIARYLFGFLPNDDEDQDDIDFIRAFDLNNPNITKDKFKCLFNSKSLN